MVFLSENCCRTPEQEVGNLVGYMHASRDPALVLAIMNFLRCMSCSVLSLRLLEASTLSGLS